MMNKESGKSANRGLGRGEKTVMGIKRRKKLARNSRALLSSSEAARLLNVHVNTIRRWSNKGTLKTYRLGTRGDRRFKPCDVASLLKSG